jgi:hypothetical protein
MPSHSTSLYSLPKFPLSQEVKSPYRNKEEYMIIMEQVKILTGVQSFLHTATEGTFTVWTKSTGVTGQLS